MSSNTVTEDLRSIKTKKALNVAMFSLLKKVSFKKITIKSICEEAIISRAAFYAHFIDKYDLLKHWIVDLWPKTLNSSDSYKQIEQAINDNTDEYVIILKNLVCDADDETLSIMFDFILSTMNLTMERNDSGENDPKNIVLSCFYAGGIITYLFWQVKNKFPTDVPSMNRYLYEIINTIKDWQSSESITGRDLT